MVTDLTLYIATTEKGNALTRDFYNLSLSKKYEVVNTMIELGILFEDMKLYDKIIKGILQHSETDIATEYPIKGQRKQSPIAKQADQLELTAAVAELTAALERKTNAENTHA